MAATARQEIAELRRQEAFWEQGAAELDHLQREVMAVDDRLVVWGSAPIVGETVWAALPRGWRQAGMLQIGIDNRLWLFPAGYTGEIAVSRALARKIIAGEWVPPRKQAA